MLGCAALLSLACGGSDAVATIRGNLVTIGATAGDPDEPTEGTVEAHAGTVNGPVAGTGTAGADGIFNLRVPAGTYYLSATVGRVLCLADAAVTVTAQSGAKTDVICTAP